MRARLAALLVLALALPATALAEGDPQPDPFTLVVDGIRGAALAQTTPDRRCPELYLGTAGLHEKDGQRALQEGLFASVPVPDGPVPAGLPARVDLRSLTQTFNRRYAFVLRDGHIYFRSQPRGLWAPLPVPACFDGDVRAISVDDDELLAVDSARHVFTMDGALRDTVWFNWTERWGPPFWTGGGRQLPESALWSWSVLSPLEDRTWTDSAGTRQPVGDAKVSHVFMVRGTQRRRIVYMDPWLPADESYEVCGPVRGRFRVAAMSAAASTVFVMNRYGDLYTRLYDFDMSGADSVFLKYAYADQRGQANPVIQLPAVDWIHQPKVPGGIRAAISIHKTGPGSDSRTLRVAGVRGYWEKALTAPRWHLVRDGESSRARPVLNPRRDSSRRGLAPSGDRAYAGSAGGLAISVPDFNITCSPARLDVRLAGGRRIALTLHHVDAVRQSPRGPELDGEPRITQGTIEAPASVLDSTDPAVRAFVATYLKGRYTGAAMDATRGALVFKEQGWTLAARTAPGPRRGRAPRAAAPRR